MIRIPAEFERNSLAVSKRDISALEETLHMRLPDDYRAFLLETNGGRPGDRDGFDIGENDASSLDVLYSVRHEKPYYSLERQRLMFENRIPKDLLPIGHDQGGSTICLGIGKKNYGKVFFWDMEDEREQPTYENVRLIAENFAEFLDSLYSDEDE